MPNTPKLRLKEGDPAPPFSALTQQGQRVALSDFRGKPVVLYFYPRDHTPGCTREACAFRDAFDRLRQLGAVVLGVSVDGVESHRRFAQKHALPFLLLADTERRIVRAYGVWGTKTFMGRKFQGTHRVTFLIGPDGRIRKIWRQVKPDTHAAEVLAALEAVLKTNPPRG